jgi:hypothetical protein
MRLAQRKIRRVVANCAYGPGGFIGDEDEAKSNRAMQAMLKINKLDIQETAAGGETKIMPAPGTRGAKNVKLFANILTRFAG